MRESDTSGRKAWRKTCPLSSFTSIFFQTWYSLEALDDSVLHIWFLGDDASTQILNYFVEWVCILSELYYICYQTCSVSWKVDDLSRCRNDQHIHLMHLLPNLWESIWKWGTWGSATVFQHALGVILHKCTRVTLTGPRIILWEFLVLICLTDALTWYPWVAKGPTPY